MLVTQLCLILCDPVNCSPAHQAPLSMGFAGKNAGVGNYCLLQGIFLTQGSNPGLLNCRQILYHLSHQEALLPPVVTMNLFSTSVNPFLFCK